MLRGEKVGLRARVEADVAVLHSELHDDVVTRSRANGHPWQPVGSGPASPYAVAAPTEDAAVFSVVRLVDDELVGDSLLWDIDLHNRTAHIGLSLRPAFRGQGLGSDVVRVLCHYGFAIRGLHRLQIETLADNVSMLRAATRSGFIQEGVQRRSSWVNGEFVDDVVLGLLDSEWRAGIGAGTSDVDPGLMRPGAISYLHIPAVDVGEAAIFYQQVFDWNVHGLGTERPGFDDGSGHISGAWMTDQAISAEPGLLPYIYVEHIDATVERINAHGGRIVTAPHAEGALWVATFRDPSGNVFGLWHAGPR